MKSILLIATFFYSITSFSQLRVSGTVKNNKGRTLAGATITLNGTYDGAVSDSAGNYSFVSVEKGDKIISASIVGNKTVEHAVILQKPDIQIDFVLKEEVKELTAVMITAGAFEASDKKKAATVLTPLDIVTTGGANGDIAAAVKTLPGAQQIGEQEGLFVRGGAGYETKQFIDGTMVNNPFYSSVPDIASRGRFSPMLFKGTVFSTGGYSALYGQALSSALILESIDMPEQSQASASVSSVFLGGGFQQLSRKKDFSWGVNYSYFNLQLYFAIVKQKPDYFKIPQIHNSDANFRIKTKRGMIKYYGTFAKMQMGLRRPDIDSVGIKDVFSLDNLNLYNNISWRENFNKGWKMNLGLGYSLNRDNIGQQLQNEQNTLTAFIQTWMQNKNFNLYQRQDLSQIRLVMEKKLIGISVLRFGGEYQYSWNKTNYNNYSSLLTDHYKALFSEADLYITNNLAAKAGIRAEHSSIINKMNVAPRLSLAYKTGKNEQVSVAYGEFYQKPENTHIMQTADLGFIRATHYIANFQKTSKNYTFRAEGFYKKYNDLIKTVPSVNNSGAGYASGFELFWRDKKSIKNLDYWVSYSYLDTKRDYLNYPEMLTPTFAAEHTVSVVAKRWVSDWKTGFNFTYSYATGRPYYNFRSNGSTGKTEIADRGITKEYHNLGFSCNYVPTLGKSKKNFIVLVASITNVLGANPVYGYNYSYTGSKKEAVTPAAPRFFFIGAFFSWGVDRTQDAINNNL
ncbi:TonB-dependent receptor [soil metagenome]